MSSLTTSNEDLLPHMLVSAVLLSYAPITGVLHQDTGPVEDTDLLRGSEVKNLDHSSKGSGFNTQHPLAAHNGLHSKI